MRGYALLAVFYILGTSIIYGQNIGLQVDGLVGIGTDNPQTELHIVGDVTTPWGITWYQYQANFIEKHKFKPWLKRAWSSSTGDYLYLSGVGNRSNNEQAAIFLSEKKGLIVGRGSDEAVEIEDEFLRIDTSGSVIIDNLKGKAVRSLTIDANGTIGTKAVQEVLNFGKYSFHPSSTDAELSRDFAWIEPISNSSFTLGAPIMIPEGSTIDTVQYHYIDDCSTGGMTFKIDGVDFKTANVLASVGMHTATTGGGAVLKSSPSIAVGITTQTNFAYHITVSGVGTCSSGGSTQFVIGTRIVYTPPN